MSAGSSSSPLLSSPRRSACSANQPFGAASRASLLSSSIPEGVTRTPAPKKLASVMPACSSQGRPSRAKSRGLIATM
eukprot:9489457-Pyramimonas_sp.AAC.1